MEVYLLCAIVWILGGILSRLEQGPTYPPPPPARKAYKPLSPAEVEAAVEKYLARLEKEGFDDARI